jgi:hypothetical protein
MRGELRTAHRVASVKRLPMTWFFIPAKGWDVSRGGVSTHNRHVRTSRRRRPAALRLRV